jgi:hypothetical protein
MSLTTTPLYYVLLRSRFILVLYTLFFMLNLILGGRILTTLHMHAFLFLGLMFSPPLFFFLLGGLCCYFSCKENCNPSHKVKYEKA